MEKSNNFSAKSSVNLTKSARKSKLPHTIFKKNDTLQSKVRHTALDKNDALKSKVRHKKYDKSSTLKSNQVRHKMTKKSDEYDMLDSKVPHSIIEENDLIEKITSHFIGPPTNESKIFFIETSLSSEDGYVSLNPRQACAIESAAFTNPDYKIYVYILTRKNQNFDEKLVSKTVEILLSYINVEFEFVELSSFFLNSPLQNLYKSGTLEQSKYVSSHLSDVMRFLTLWKYSGIYLDMDLIVQKSFNKIRHNFACAESIHLVNGAVLSLVGQKGREFGELFLKDLNKHFDGKKLASNGPAVLTRVLKKVCGTQNLNIMIPEVCNGFSVLPSDYCFKIPYHKNDLLFRATNSSAILDSVKNSFVVHFWNKLTYDKKLTVNSTAAYVQLAKKFCPNIFESCDEYF